MNTFDETELIEIKTNILNIEDTSMLINVRISNNMEKRIQNIKVTEVLNDVLDDISYISNLNNNGVNIEKNDDGIVFNINNVEGGSTKDIKYVIYFKEDIYSKESAIAYLLHTDIEYEKEEIVFSETKYNNIPLIAVNKSLNSVYINENNIGMLTIVFLIFVASLLIKIITNKRKMFHKI